MQHGDVHGQQQQGLAGTQQGPQGEGRDRQMDGEGVTQGPLQVGADAPPQGQGLHQGREVITQQHQIRRLTRHRRSVFAHRNTDISRLQGRGVVDPVAAHRHHLAGGLQGLNQLQFLLRHDAREHGGASNAAGQFAGAELLQVWTTDHRPGRQTGLVGDRAGCHRAVAGDHHHPHPRRPRPGDGGRHLGPEGIGQADQADRFKGKGVHIGWWQSRRFWVIALMQRRSLEPAGHGQHPQTGSGQAIGRLQQRGAGLRIEMTELDHRLRRSLGGHLPPARRRAPELRKHQQLAAEGIVAQQGPVGVEVFTVLQLRGRQALDGHLHRIDRIVAAGENRQFQQPMPRLPQRFALAPERLFRPGEQLHGGHAVFRERSGLVNRQHRGAAEALHGGGPAGQDTDPPQAQGAQGQKQCQHHRDLVGQHRQCQGQRRQQCLHPPAAQGAMNHQQHGAEGQCQHRQPAGEPAGVALEPGERCPDPHQALAQPSELGLWTHGNHLGPAVPAGHQ